MWERKQGEGYTKKKVISRDIDEFILIFKLRTVL